MYYVCNIKLCLTQLGSPIAIAWSPRGDFSMVHVRFEGHSYDITKEQIGLTAQMNNNATSTILWSPIQSLWILYNWPQTKWWLAHQTRGSLRVNIWQAYASRPNRKSLHTCSMVEHYPTEIMVTGLIPVYESTAFRTCAKHQNLIRIGIKAGLISKS